MRAGEGDYICVCVCVCARNAKKEKLFLHLKFLLLKIRELVSITLYLRGIQAYLKQTDLHVMER